MMGWAKIQSAATATLLLILTTGILSLGLRHLLAQSGGGVRAPSAVAVLERYEQSLKALSQIGFEAELRQQWTYPGQSSPSDRTNYYLTHWRDGDRWDTSYRIEAVDAQGDLLRLDEHGSPMPSPPTIRGVIGPMTFSYTRQEGRLLQVGMMEKPEPSSLFVQKKRCMHLEATLLSGYSPEDSGLALVEVLHSDKSLIVREGMAQVDGHRTYVLEGTGRYGRHELWLDPAAGYCPRRIVLEKSAGDLFQGKRLSSSLSDSAAHYDPFKPEAPLSKYLLQLDSMQLQQIQGVWVPVACAIIEQRTYANAQQVVTKCQYTRRNIQLRPDFSGVGAFEVDVPDGTPVNYEDGPNAGRVGMFQWRGGKVVPVSGRRDLR